MFLTQNLMIVLVLLVLSIHSFESTSADPTYVSHACSNGNTYVSNSSYQQNLNTLLSSLPGKVRDSGGFHNDTAGNGPSKVHGLFLCRDNESSPTCQDCVNFAAGDVTKRCRLAKEAVIWYDECLLRYSDRYIFSVMDTNLNYTWRNTTNFTDPERLNNLTKKLIGGTAEEAVNSSRRLATKVSNVTVAFQKQSFLVNFRMHSILQCTLDLSTGDCDRCLRGAIAMLPTCCNVTMEARLYLPSCYVRYGIHSFSNETMPSVRRRSPTVPAAPPPDGSRRRTPASIPPSPSATDSAIKPPGRKLKEIAIGASTAGFVLVLLLCYWLWWLLRKNKTEEKQPKKNNELLHLRDGRIREDYLLTGEKQEESEDFPLLPFSLILEATQHFSEENKLGQGGFGPVFKGVLPDGKELAVKRLSEASAQGLKEFKNEVTLIAKLQHKNLVRLLGCCIEGDELMLVYEYMPNKSLDFFIFDPTRGAQLDWKRRISIINGIARGILYLHEDSRLRIIHRDLKAGNVLLDHEMNPKISDFGMARIFGGNQTEDNTKRPVGTYGYMAPEYAMEGLFSVKSDVFSFGVLLLEIISGKRNTRFHLAEEGQSLLTYTWKLWCEGRAVEVMDPVLMQSCALGEALRCIQIGLLCVQEDPADRPTMSTVVLMLGSVNMLLPQPTEPAFSVGRVVMRANRSSPNVRCSTNQVTLSTLSGR